VSADGATRTTIAGGITLPACTGALVAYTFDQYEKLSLDAAGNLWTSGTACGGTLGASTQRALVRRTPAGAYDAVVLDSFSIGSMTLANDVTNNLYFTTTNGRLRRRAASDGAITTLAGTAGMTTMSTGDFGPATAALLQDPRGVAVLPGGRVVVGEILAGGAYMLRVLW
jgi:ABC-type glycerol-3-phosphate transport system substrate-binding protein